MENTSIIYEGGCDVSTFAGSPVKGHRNGAKRVAQFKEPSSVAVDMHGDIYIADSKNHRLWKINATDSNVHTVAGTGEPGFKDGPGREAQLDTPYGVAVDANGDIIITERRSTFIRAFSPATNTVRTIAKRELWPWGVAVSAEGSILVCDAGNHRIVKINADGGVMETVAGEGIIGYVDGEVKKARFNRPVGIAASFDGDIYVADRGNHCIRKIHVETGMVITVAGTDEKGWRDGDAGAAQFSFPNDLAIAADGCVYISEAGNHSIRKLDPADKRVVTIAGTGKEGFCDGESEAAQFNNPCGLSFGPDGVLYVACVRNHCIRAITLPTAGPENELEAIEKELKKKIQRKKELAQDVQAATTLTVLIREDAKKTKDATVQAKKKLVEMHQKMQATHSDFRAVIEQRKAQLELLNAELLKMENVKTQRETELATAKGELEEAQTALNKVTTENEIYAQKVKLAKAHLRRAQRTDNGKCGKDVGEEEDEDVVEKSKVEEAVSDTTETKADKESEERSEVEGEPSGTKDKAALLGTNARKEEEKINNMLERSSSEQEIADRTKNITDSVRRMEKVSGEHSKDREARLKKMLGLRKQADGCDANAKEEAKETEDTRK